MTTGQTIYETIVSVDTNNNPISAATFTTSLYKNGEICIENQINVSLSDGVNAVFSASWSAASYGNYQLYAKNNVTSVIYMSEAYSVVSPDEERAVVYIGI